MSDHAAIVREALTPLLRDSFVRDGAEVVIAKPGELEPHVLATAALAALDALEQERDVWASKSQANLRGWNAATERAEAAETRAKSLETKGIGAFIGVRLIEEDDREAVLELELASVRKMVLNQRDTIRAAERELAEAKRLLALRDDAYKSSMRERAIARAEAAEAELAEAKRERDEWQRHAGTSDREVARLRVIVLSILAALALPRIDESLLWQDAGTAILGRVEEIIDQADVDVARAEAAEAERDKLREALRQIATPKDHKHGDKHPSAIARAALAGKEGT